MPEAGKVYPTELHLLKKALEAQGELIDKERLERKAELDQLRLEMATLKNLFEKLTPGFLHHFEILYNEERQKFNPELLKSG